MTNLNWKKWKTYLSSASQWSYSYVLTVSQETFKYVYTCVHQPSSKPISQFSSDDFLSLKSLNNINTFTAVWKMSKQKNLELRGKAIFGSNKKKSRCRW